MYKCSSEMNKMDSNTKNLSVPSALPPPPLPPPPPPPPPVMPTTKTHNLNCNDKKELGANESSNPMLVSPGQRAYEMILEKGNVNNDDEKYVCFSYHQNVEGIIQSGPQCGVVSLAMAASLLKLQDLEKIRPQDLVDMLMNDARILGYTQQGEMLAADYIIDLLNRLVDGSEYRGIILDTVKDYGDIVTALLDGNPLLVPYDTDKNYSPCLRKGHKAHWALLAGFFICLEKTCGANIEDMIKNSPIDVKYPCLYHCNTCSNCKLFQDLSLLSADKVWVYAYHGKSKYPGIWSLKDLIESNRNLFEFDPERVKEGGYVIPDGGIKDGLCNKIILIKRC